MLHHFTLRDPVDLPGLEGLLRHGYLAVDLFFVLSGFVMARAYGTWFGVTLSWRDAAGAYGQFLLRRVARLWPLHASVVLLILAHRAALGERGMWPSMVASNLLMVQAWGLSQTLNVPSWSVSTEMAAYALFPGLAALALHGTRGLAWAALAFAVVLLAVSVAGLEDGRRGLLDVYANWSVRPLLRCVGGFTIGMLALRAAEWTPLRALLQRPGAAEGALLGLLAGMSAGVPDVLLYPLLPMLVAALQVGQGVLRRALGFGTLQGLGALSYALYLVHYPVLDAVPPGLPPALRFAAFLLGSAAVAVVASWAIERPGRRALRRLGRALQARPGPVLPG